MAPITPQALRARFREAVAERDAIQAASKPLRDQRTALREQIAPLEEQDRRLVEQIKHSEAGLFDLQNEIGMIVRALNGNTAEPVDETRDNAEPT